MTFAEIKNAVMFQFNYDTDDLGEFLPYIDRYVNDGYDEAVYAWDRAHVQPVLDGTEPPAYPELKYDNDAPRLPDWTHWALSDYATWLVYRNGNPQKQQRGMHYKLRFDGVIARIRAENGAAGRRDRFVNVYSEGVDS